MQFILTTVVVLLVMCLIGIAILSTLYLNILTEVKAMKGSTHQVAYVARDDFEKINDELRQKINRDVNDIMETI